MAYPVVESATTSTSALSGDALSTINIASDGSIQDNDIEIAVIRCKPGGTISLPSPDPDGWSFVGTQVNTSGVNSVIAKRVYTTGRGTTSTFSSTGTTRWTAVNMRISGADTSAPVNAIGTSSGYAPTTTPTSPSITTTADGCLILAGCNAQYDYDNLTINAGLASEYDYDSGTYNLNGGLQACGSAEQASQGATSSYAHTLETITYGRFYTVFSLAIAPSGAVPTVTISFDGVTNPLLVNDGGTANIAAVTPLTNVVYEVYPGHLTGFSNAFPVVTDDGSSVGTCTIDDGATTITVTNSELGSADEVTVVLYHSNATEPKTYHAVVD